MKLIPGMTVLVVMLLPFIVTAAEKPAEVIQLRNGFYVSTIDLDGRIVKRYLVDTRARLCFFSDSVIPCENLKLREEWREIITWVK